MKKTMRKVGVMVVIIAMILASVQISAFAKLPDYYYIIFNSNANHIITEGSGVGEIVVDGQNITAQDADTNNPIGEVSILNEGTEARIKIPYDDEVKLSFNTENKFDVFYQGQNYSMETVLNKDVCENWEYIFLAIQDHTNPPPAGNGENQVGQPSNASAKVTVTGGEGGYTEKRYNPELHQDVEENVSYKKSYGDAMISINDRGVEIPFEDNMPESFSINEFGYGYQANDYAGTENEGKVKIFLGSRIDRNLVGTFKINDTEYNVNDYINYKNRENWLDHYNRQLVGFDVYVEKADEYNIEVNVEPADETTCYVGNFLWTGDSSQEYELDMDGNPVINPENGEKVKNDNYIGHSKLQLVKVEYERNGKKVVRDFTKQTTIDELDRGEREAGPGRYYHDFEDGDLEYGYKTKEDNKSINYDDGSLVVPEGAIVTMKIVPDYGYQVTSFGINGSNIITGDSISEFSFEIKKGNFHLGAEVTEVENKVKTTTDAIKEGKVVIADDEIDSGSVELSVKDTEVSDKKKAEFANNVPDGYEVTGYADISLAQVFYKGSEDNVWTVEKEDLNKDATITLKLEEGIDPENTALVHNVYDGEEFENVDYTYNADTKEITFKTKTFSNYAIATKVETTENVEKTENTEESKEEKNEKQNASNPKTGDNIIRFVVIFAISSICFIKFAKKYRISAKH